MSSCSASIKPVGLHLLDCHSATTQFDGYADMGTPGVAGSHFGLSEEGEPSCAV